MRNRKTSEYLGLWETLYNPNFKPTEFEGFRNEGNQRDYATINQLICISNMENINAVMINENVPQKREAFRREAAQRARRASARAQRSGRKEPRIPQLQRLKKLNEIAIQQCAFSKAMTDKQIQHTIEMYHRKAMRELTKRLRAAIEQASKTRCWYNGWKHEGQLADYGVLYEPMRKFISEAQFSDICAMCEFLMAKANAQIEKSNDDGNCAGQARYWMEKLLKALMKSEVDIAEKMAWLEDFQKHDDYSLADFARTMLNKRNTLSQEDWSRLADMKIARFKNSPKVEDDGRSDEDIRSWQGDYDNIVRALKCMKSIFFISGRAKEFRARVQSMIERNKRRRNLVDALEGL